MGTSHSHLAPPLVSVDAPGGNLLVPAGATFSVHPPTTLGSRYPFPSKTRQRGLGRGAHHVPVYRPLGREFPFEEGYSLGRGPGIQRGPRVGPKFRARGFGSELGSAESLFAGEGMSASGDMGGWGGGLGGKGPPPGAYLNARERQTHSMPDLPTGGFPFMGQQRGGMELPRGGMGPPRGYGAGNGATSMFPPPGYTGNSGETGFGEQHSFGHPGGRSDSPPLPPPIQPHQQPPGGFGPPGLHDIPMGAFTSAAMKPTRSRSDPPTSARVNRKQPADKKVGPSGNEWLEGDPFLDACLCTTNCTCRKGQRIMYRSKAQSRDSDLDPQYGQGEIRYVLKEDVGRDCGDHSRCNKRSQEERRGNENGISRRQTKAKERARKEEFRGLKEDLLEALDDKMDEIRYEQRHALGRRSRRPGFRAQSRTYPVAMQDMEYPINDAVMGMQGGRRTYPTMPDAMRNPRMSMDPPMGPMGRVGGGRPFGDDVSLEEMEGMGGAMDMGNPYATTTPWAKHRRAPPPEFMNPRRGRGQGRPRGPLPGMGLGLDMGSFGRGMGSRPPRGGLPRRPTMFNDENVGGELGTRRGARSLASEEDDWETTGDASVHDDENEGSKPHSRSPRRKRGSDRGCRAKGSRSGRQQAHVEDDDDDDDGF